MTRQPDFKYIYFYDSIFRLIRGCIYETDTDSGHIGVLNEHILIICYRLVIWLLATNTGDGLSISYGDTILILCRRWYTASELLD